MAWHLLLDDEQNGDFDTTATLLNVLISVAVQQYQQQLWDVFFPRIPDDESRRIMLLQQIQFL